VRRPPFGGGGIFVATFNATAVPVAFVGIFVPVFVDGPGLRGESALRAGSGMSWAGSGGPPIPIGGPGSGDAPAGGPTATFVGIFVPTFVPVFVPTFVPVFVDGPGLRGASGGDSGDPSSPTSDSGLRGPGLDVPRLYIGWSPVPESPGNGLL